MDRSSWLILAAAAGTGAWRGGGSREGLQGERWEGGGAGLRGAGSPCMGSTGSSGAKQTHEIIWDPACDGQDMSTMSARKRWLKSWRIIIKKGFKGGLLLGTSPHCCAGLWGRGRCVWGQRGEPGTIQPQPHRGFLQAGANLLIKGPVG